jgi:anhydro-N-acetylmuramic acid kinase
VNNLGGISNVTAIDWRKSKQPRVLAFDTGPANVLIDLAVRHFTDGHESFDRDGRWAGRGEPLHGCLDCWLKHRYFRKTPPKSTGRELFGEQFFAQAFSELQAERASQFDVLRTFTEFTAASLALNYRLHIPNPVEKVILTGGGAANPVLTRAITEALRAHSPHVTVTSSANLGWPVQCLEPAAFALLAYLRLNNQPGNLPATTGAARPVLCGQITEP